MYKGLYGEVADLLFELGAIQFGAFKLKLHETQPDAPLSPIYLNLRTRDNPKPGPLTDEALELIGRAMADVIEYTPRLHFDYLAGIPNAGDPFADVVTKALGKNAKPQLRLGKVETDGKRRIVAEGQAGTPGKIVLLTDDLITQADSKFEAIGAVMSLEMLVRDILVLVDRQQGGAEQLLAAGYYLTAVLTLEGLLNHYTDTGRIDWEKRMEVIEYIKANKS